MSHGADAVLPGSGTAAAAGADYARLRRRNHVDHLREALEDVQPLPVQAVVWVPGNAWALPLRARGAASDTRMHLRGTKINGDFSLREAHLAGTFGRALTAQRLTVTEDMFFDGRFRADGEINLSGASVGGHLCFGGGHLDGGGGPDGRSAN